MITLNGASANLCGLSTDSKPTTDVPVNTLFLELDTGNFWYFNGSAWQKIGGEV